MSTPSALLAFQPLSMSSAQLAAVSYLARYSGRTHTLYAFHLRQWFAWCEPNGLTRWSGSNGPMSSCTSAILATPGGWTPR